MTVKDTLAARGKHYEGPGGYADTAATAQDLKDVMFRGPNWQLGRLSAAQKESLHMIANKIARIVNGDPNHADSWHDIAGYATLAEKLCPALVKVECYGAGGSGGIERTHADGEVKAGVLGKSMPVLGAGPLEPERKSLDDATQEEWDALRRPKCAHNCGLVNTARGWHCVDCDQFLTPDGLKRRSL